MVQVSSLMRMKNLKCLQQVKKKTILAVRDMPIMMEHNVLMDKISAARRYRKLQDLKLTIDGLKRKFPLRIATELEARATEKLRNFDYPICTVARIKIIFSDGLSKYLDQDGCQKTMVQGMKLSDYLFS